MNIGEFGAYLILEGYRDVRFIDNNTRWIGLMQFAFTAAIVVGRTCNPLGYDDRWCYHSMAAAKSALAEWEGEGEPKGWHRHPLTGRRIAETDREFDQDGELVLLGDTYVRF